MALKLILGASGSGKSRLLFETALKNAQAHPDRRYIVLVPEQFTLQTQRDLTQLSQRGGILNIDVLSFTRLAYRVFEQTGFTRRSVLSETGKSLMLRLIASRMEGSLELLSGIMDRPGTVAELKSILSELDQYQIEPQQLLQLEEELKKENGKGRLQRKIHEIRVLRELFEQYQADRYITGEKLPRILSQKAPQDPTLKGTEFFLDGYTGFTPAQLEVITAILPIASDITVTVTIDPDEPELRYSDPIHSLAVSKPRPYELFALSKQTISALIRAAEQAHVPVQAPVVLDGKQGRQKEGSELAWLESHLFRSGRWGMQPYPAPAPGTNPAQRQIFLRQCADPYDEVLSAAVTVEELIRSGYRYRDIAIVCGSLPEYAEYAKRVLTRYRIPFFIDRSSPVVLNPAFEFVESSIEIMEKNFSYESVMRLLRTSLALDPGTGETDILENYLIAAGIRGRAAWEKPFTRPVREGGMAPAQAAEPARAHFMERFAPYADVMKKGKAPLRERAKALWELLLAFDVPAKLDGMRAQSEADGRMDRAEEYGQVIRVIADVLDEAVLLIGDETVTRTQFMQILRAGFSEAKIGIIPPGIDEVHVGDLQRTRLEHIRAVLFLGMNDGFVPQKKGKGGVLTDMEREYLGARKVHLAPTVREDANIQQFYLYLTLTKPSDLLLLSWSAAQRDGKEMRRAYVTDFVEALFPGRELLQPVSVRPYRAVTSRETGLGVLAVSLSDYLGSDEAAAKSREPALKELLKLYLTPEEGWRETAASILRAAPGSGEAAVLDEQTAAKLYGSILSGSISRLEHFARCPFLQYAEYGLRLREREEFTVQLPDIGNLLHRAIELFSKRLLDNPEGMTWNTIPDDVRDRWAAEAVREAAGAGVDLYEDTQRGRTTLRRCGEIMARSVRTIQRQVRAGLFVPARFEVEFGGGESDLVQISSLPGGGRMRLRGRIDRIDECDDPDEKKLYVKIVDYKSSTHDLRLDGIIDGEQLQLLVYMDEAARMEQAAHPDRKIVCAGIFYYNMQDPLIKEEEIRTTAEDAVLKKMRVTGFMDRDPEVVRRLDATLTPGDSSLVVPVKLDSKGNPTNPAPQSKGLLNAEQIALLRGYVRDRMRRSAAAILSGEIAPHPARRSDQSIACGMCSFGDVCHFDPHEKGMEYALRESRGDAECWRIIRGEAEGTSGGGEAEAVGEEAAFEEKPALTDQTDAGQHKAPAQMGD